MSQIPPKEVINASFILAERYRVLCDKPINQVMTNRIGKENTGKPSKQVEAVANWWRTIAAAADKHESLEAARDFGEGGQVLLRNRGRGLLRQMWVCTCNSWAVPKKCKEWVTLCFHGVDFFRFDVHPQKAIRSFCRATLLPLILQYRYSPEHQYPAQLEDSFGAYKWLLIRA